MKLGFFDSGLGGLLVMESCMKALPEHSYVYLGDTKNIPYGPKSSDEIYEAMEPCLNYLLDIQNCDHVVVACNTASVKAVHLYKQRYQGSADKIHGISEPTVNFLKQRDYKDLLVLATQTTVQSGVYSRTAARVKQIAMPGLVPLIEAHKQQEAVLMCTDAISYEADTRNVLLGCTHYIWLIDELSRRFKNKNIFGQDWIIIDYLRGLELAATKDEDVSTTYLVTGDPQDYLENYGHNFTHCDIT